MWSSVVNAFQNAFNLIQNPTEYFLGILKTTMLMSANTTLWSSIFGITIGCIIALHEFKGKKIIVTILRTLMGFPPVAMGILLYLIFSSSGPLGYIRLLYTVKLMVIAQVCLITPIVAGMTETALTPFAQKSKSTLVGLNINPFKKAFLVINEGKVQIISAIMFAFARSIAEVGAVQIVGGNIMGSTEVMTTAIMGYYNTGGINYSLGLAIILLAISLLVNIVATIITFAGRKK